MYGHLIVMITNSSFCSVSKEGVSILAFLNIAHHVWVRVI